MNISGKLDAAFAEASKLTFDEIASRLPSGQVDSFLKWKFGAYGWTSPVNLLITAAWYKWLFPAQDVCKIWAADHKKSKIDGGYAIRSNDEKYTVPLVTKTGISSGFCSPNSGMQGSRAIEKMRGQGRIGRNTPIDQAVSFDMALFQNLMNDINECDDSSALDVLLLLLRIGIDRNNERVSALSKMSSKESSTDVSVTDIVEFTITVRDPQFVKIAIACLLRPVVASFIGPCELTGMDGKKTAADSQSKAMGDFSFKSNESNTLVGVEVKDQSKSVGFDILQAIENRKANNPEMKHYIAVSAAPIAVSEQNLKDPYWNQRISRLRDSIGVNVTVISILELAGLYRLANGDDARTVTDITKFLSASHDLKPETIASWQTKFLR